MKKLMSKVVVMAAVLGAWTTGWSAINFVGSAGSYSATWSGTPTAIPDYPGSGLAFELNFTDADYPHITAVSVTFTTSGGWNGDLYAYLSHGDGIAILLNRVGANSLGEDGYGTSGFNTITLSSDGVGDIHTIAAPTSVDGPYEADGRWDYTSGTRGQYAGGVCAGECAGGVDVVFLGRGGVEHVDAAKLGSGDHVGAGAGERGAGGVWRLDGHRHPGTLHARQTILAGQKCEGLKAFGLATKKSELNKDYEDQIIIGLSTGAIPASSIMVQTDVVFNFAGV